MSQAASQAATFFRDVSRTQKVWTIQDAGGYPAPLTGEGKRAQPFWSSLSRTQRIIKTVPAYHGFEPVELSLDKFLDGWLPELEQDGLLIGVNWSGPQAIGYDYTPKQVRKRIEHERTRGQQDA